MAKFNFKDLSPKMDGKFYYGYVMLLMGFMCMFIAYVVKANCSSLFITPLCEELDISRTAYTQTNTLMTVCMLIGSSFMGKLMSKYKLRYVLSGCCLLLTVTFLLMSRATALWQLYVLNGLQGFAWAGATNLPVNIMVSNWFGPKVKGTMMSIGMLGSGAGALVFVPIIQNLITNSGWRTAYLAMAGFMAIMLVLALAFCVNLPEEKGFTRRIGDPSKEEIAATGGVAVTKRGITAKSALKMGRWWCQFLAAAITMIGASAFTTQAVAYFGDIGMENGAAIYSSALGTLIVGKFIVGAISDVIGIKRVAVISPLFYGAVFVFLALCSGNTSMSWGVIICYMIGGAIPSTVPALLTVRNFGDKEYGTLTGWMNMAGNIGQIIGPTAAAAVFDITGTYVFAWWVFAALFVVVAVLYYLSGVLNKKELKAQGYDPDM